MPHTRSAAKRLRQSFKRNKANKDAVTAIKTHMKRVATAASAGDLGKAKTELRLAMQKIDKAAKIHAIHRNEANRRKAQIARMVSGAAAKPASKPAK